MREKQESRTAPIHDKHEKTELKSSEMQIAPQGRNLSSKHGIMWARKATFT